MDLPLLPSSADEEGTRAADVLSLFANQQAFVKTLKSAPFPAPNQKRKTGTPRNLAGLTIDAVSQVFKDGLANTKSNNTNIK